MNKAITLALAAVFVLASRFDVVGGVLENGSFEDPVGPEGASDGWGHRGEVIGEAEGQDSGTAGSPENARDGSRVLRINVPVSTWNGIWQQINLHNVDAGLVSFRASYQIMGGDLPSGVATIMKMEFYDSSGSEVGSEAGNPHTHDTQGQWEDETVSAHAPSDTAAIRFKLVAGRNDSDEAVTNRIFWDNVEVEVENESALSQ